MSSKVVLKRYVIFNGYVLKFNDRVCKNWHFILNSGNFALNRKKITFSYVFHRGSSIEILNIYELQSKFMKTCRLCVIFPG